jgi:predicted nucleic acid-binding protein
VNLLDTCVVSDLAKARPHEKLRRWFEATPEAHLHLSVLTLGEIAKGLAALPAGRRRNQLAGWLDEVRSSFRDRLLGVDAETAETWGRLAGEAARKGRPVAVIDGLIAATAIHHGLSVVTRNVSDFVETGAAIVDPYK